MSAVSVCCGRERTKTTLEIWTFTANKMFETPPYKALTNASYVNNVTTEHHTTVRLFGLVNVDNNMKFDTCTDYTTPPPTTTTQINASYRYPVGHFCGLFRHRCCHDNPYDFNDNTVFNTVRSGDGTPVDIRSGGCQVVLNDTVLLIGGNPSTIL